MSFSDQIESCIQRFIESVSLKHSLDKEELVKLWNGSSAPAKKDKPKAEPKAEPKVKPASSTEENDLSKLAKPELVSLCKVRGLKTTGVKQVLIDRLLGKEPSTAPPKKSSSSPKKEEILKKIQQVIPQIQLKKNAFGFFEHPETKLVFDKITNRVIGKQNVSGKVDPLVEGDIELCNKFGFKFDMPENLNSTSKTKISIEGLEDEDDVQQAGETMEGSEVEFEEVEEEEEELVEDEIADEDD